MAYNKINPKDHIVEFPNRYEIQDNGDGTVTFIPRPGQTIQQGTSVSQTVVGQMDNGIYDAHTQMADFTNVELPKKIDKPVSAVSGRVATFDASKNVVDSGKSIADLTLPAPNTGYQTYDEYLTLGQTIIKEITIGSGYRNGYALFINGFRLDNILVGVDVAKIEFTADKLSATAIGIDNNITDDPTSMSIKVAEGDYLTGSAVKIGVNYSLSQSCLSDTNLAIKNTWIEGDKLKIEIVNVGVGDAQLKTKIRWAVF